MDLPLDHFRLLGVGPATDAQSVLRTLQLRLDRPPEQGYTAETLHARAELLRASADLLSDPPRRASYESDLTALASADEQVIPALEVPTSREVAGLLLLLEAGQPLEAFQMASRCLQPPQAPALGSGREADLTLLAGESALAAADELGRQRLYESAARILQQGLQLLQRMGQLPELRERILAELEALAPFRVLDLLSRDPAASQPRGEGLALLDQLVQRRGGLEGNDDASFAPEEFQRFFKQIRSFLTVQEQLDLFDRWAARGSEAADFLASIALTASGFAQRKPERIAAARDRLQASGRAGLDPLIANLDLLLGDVDGGLQRFEAGADAELSGWAARQSDDPLARLCAWCRDWLSRDVLPGYRDLDADADLEAYFSDRDVTAWVEREDRLKGRSFMPQAAAAGEPALRSPGAAPGSAAAGGLFDPGSGGFLTAEPLPFPGLEPWSPGPGLPAAPPAESPLGRGSRRRADSGSARDSEDEANESLAGVLDALRQRLEALPRPLGLSPWISLALVSGLVVLILAGLLGRGRTPRTASAPVPAAAPTPPRPAPAPPAAAPSPAPPPAPARPAAALAPSATAAVPLTAAEPTEAQIQALLQAWLEAKTSAVAGQALPTDLDRIARPGPIDRLEAEQSQLRRRGERQDIRARVRSLEIRERSAGRIAAVAELDYSDSTRAKDGREVSRTAPTSLRNLYVFGRDGQTWRLAASSAAP